MHRPRVRLVVVASLFTAAAALGASCSFPVLTFQDGSSGSGGSTGPSTSTSSTMDTTTSSVGGSTTSESASTSGSTSSGTGGGLPCATTCDCDDDGVKADSPECGGTDCADYDERAHPGAGYPSDIKPIQGPRHAGIPEYDFNCNTKAEAEFIVSPGCMGLAATGCTGNGFDKTTACGVLGTFITCGPMGLGCAELNRDMRYQLCK